MSIRLSARLREIVRLCGSGKVLADVGCDHAFVSITLVGSGAYEKAIAMDIRTGPLKGAAQNIADAGLADRIETRLSDGLEKLEPGEADTVLISGMGGDLIMRILDAGEECLAGAGRLVLGPQSHVPEVRRFLHYKGFKITDESFTEDDGKYYSLIAAVHGEDSRYSEADHEFGRLNLIRRDGTLREWLEKKADKLDTIIDSLKALPDERAAERAGELSAEKKLILAALRQIRSGTYDTDQDT